MTLVLGGREVQIDAEDAPKVMGKSWYDNGQGYLFTRIRDMGRVVRQSLHRLIVQAPKGMVVDHINGDKSDNRKSNLRLCTVAENSRNVGLTRRNRTGYKGVTFDRKRKKYRAQVGIGGRIEFLGYFPTPQQAHEAYVEAALRLHGEFANDGSRSLNMRLDRAEAIGVYSNHQRGQLEPVHSS